MSNTVFVRVTEATTYEWLTLSDSARRPDSGDANRLQQACEKGRVVLLAPADKVTLKVVQFDASERKLLAQTLPYSLEDEISVDVESLHFALGPVADNQVPVAIVERALVAQWLMQFAEIGIEIAAILPEQLALPRAESCWTVVQVEGGAILRYGEYLGCSLDDAIFELGLQTLLNEQQQAPEQLDLYAPAQAQAGLVARLPELLKSRVVTHDEDYRDWLVRDFSGAVAINLLQGEFARSLPWGKWWSQWRVAAIVAAVAIGLGWITAWVRVSDLEAQNLALRTQTEQAYRQAIPRGRIVDAERQLRRQVNSMKGQSGDGFVKLFEGIAQVLAAADGVEIQALTYSDAQSEIRLTLIGGSFNDIETVRTNIEKKALKAELTGSSNEGGKTRARLRIQG